VHWLAKHDHAMPTSLQLGVMVEVPSLLWQLEEICEVADFLSVGSNDLMQYIFAIDRDNKRVSGRFDALSVPMLRALKSVAQVGRAKGKPVALCGEMSGKPVEAMALIGLGYRNLSMAPSSLGPVKAMVLALDAGEVTAMMDDLLDGGESKATVRERLRRYAEDRHIPL
jgi:phosphotransferase system, enzyme I, PtsP